MCEYIMNKLNVNKSYVIINEVIKIYELEEFDEIYNGFALSQYSEWTCL
jgi:hypothetical protein